MSSGLIDQSESLVPEQAVVATPVRMALDAREIRRRLWHMSPGLLPVILWFVPHRDPISPTMMAIVGAVAIALAGRIYFQFMKIQRLGETNDGTAVLGYALSVLAAFLLFPAHAEIGFAVLAILAFGDGSATLVGLAIQGPRLPWNSSKSWAGALGFVGVGLPAAATIYWMETHNLEAIGPGVNFWQALICVAPAVVVAMLAESVPSKINDNIRVGIVAVLSLATTHAVMFGL